VTSGMIINTSFNVRGEPKFCSPEDAWSCFTRTRINCLVMVNYLFNKKDQKEPREFKSNFDLD